MVTFLYTSFTGITRSLCFTNQRVPFIVIIIEKVPQDIEEYAVSEKYPFSSSEHC